MDRVSDDERVVAEPEKPSLEETDMFITKTLVHRSAAARASMHFCRATALVLSTICGSIAAQDSCCSTTDAPVGPNSTYKTPYKWPNGQVYYTFDSSVTTSSRQAVRRAMDELEAAANLRFVQASSYAGRTVLKFKNHSSRNYVTQIGMMPNVNPFLTMYQPVYIQSWSHGILLHEIMHTLGYHHEQNRPDRDNYVRINWSCINSDWKDQYKKVDGAKTYSAYDFESVMHYSSYASSIGPCQQITVLPAYAHMQSKLGQRRGLSCGDALGLVRVYGAPKGAADLAGSSLSAASNAEVGTKLQTPQIWVYNYGNAGYWGSVTFSLYLSRDRTFDSTDVRLGGFRSDCVRILPKSSVALKPSIGSASIPSSVAPGEYWIVAVLARHDQNHLNDKTPFYAFRIWKPGTIQSFGAACIGSNGSPAHSSYGAAEIGGVQYFELRNGPKSSATMLYFGSSATTWNAFRLPLALDFIGATGCRLYTNPAVVLSFPTTSTGSLSVRYTHPNNPVYFGLTFFTQFVSYDPAANALGLTYSNAVSTRVGFPK